MKWVYDDGGRKGADFKGDADDCVTRAIAIATGLPYRKVYDDLYAMNTQVAAEDAQNGRRKRKIRKISPRNGVNKRLYDAYLKDMGAEWVPTMHVGSGCQVHLREGELPKGNIIARCSRHLVAVIDGVMHDTFDASRDGTRCVYGYYRIK